MALTAARKKANAKYEAKAYDKTLIRLPKGRLDEIRAHIEPAGESLNGFIGRAISETMERDSETAGQPRKLQESPQNRRRGLRWYLYLPKPSKQRRRPQKREYGPRCGRPGKEG